MPLQKIHWLQTSYVISLEKSPMQHRTDWSVATVVRIVTASAKDLWPTEAMLVTKTEPCFNPSLSPIQHCDSSNHHWMYQQWSAGSRKGGWVFWGKWKVHEWIKNPEQNCGPSLKKSKTSLPSIWKVTAWNISHGLIEHMTEHHRADLNLEQDWTSCGGIDEGI